MISILLAAAAAVFGLVAYLLWSIQPPAMPENAAEPSKLSAVPFLGSLDFFSKRYDFWRASTDLSKNGAFRFNIGDLPVTSLSGEAGRKFFFGSNELSMSEGYSALLGLGPRTSASGDALAATNDFSKWFSKRITSMLSRDVLEAALPNLIGDTKARLEELGDSGSTDPFESIYSIVFALTMRMVGAVEISQDRKMLDKVEHHYAAVDASANTYNIIFPRLPTLSLMRRYWSGTQIYLMFRKIIVQRQKEDRREQDALQFMLDQGDSLDKIIQFVIGSLFAGILNSGINAAYVFCYLALDSEWKQRCLTELEETANKFAPDTKRPLFEKLDSIPIAAWENDLPTMDLVLKESIRLNLPGAAMRRNVGGKTEMSGDVAIPNGSFVIYHLADIHRDPKVYPSPESFDPSRYLPDRAEDKKAPYGYVGWGLGRHPCLGMRFAKLEQYIILAYFLAKYDYTLEDAAGQTLSKFPFEPDLNLQHASKPSVKMFLKYQKRVG